MTQRSKTERLQAVYLSVTGGDPVVETQQQEVTSRMLREDPVTHVVGPAEHHGLADAIDDPDPA